MYYCGIDRTIPAVGRQRHDVAQPMLLVLPEASKGGFGWSILSERRMWPFRLPPHLPTRPFQLKASLTSASRRFPVDNATNHGGNRNDTRQEYQPGTSC